MMSSLYLDALDELLRPGVAKLSEQFTAAQVRFVAGCQRSDGGFGGRRGNSDLYYTDFALRALAWLAPGHAAFDRAAAYAAQLPWPRDIVECFNLLNIRRLLEQHSAGIADWATWKLDPLPLAEWLRRRLLPGGGFSRCAEDDCASAYHTFLGSLCFQLLGADMPAIQDAMDAIRALNRPDEGYAERADQTASQTSATAAAVAFLLMHDALPKRKAAVAARFLAGMQSVDGGLKAHAAVAAGDLLSTFTGLLTLWSLGGFEFIDAAGAARFLRHTARRDGGFLACEGDDSPDVEYTYYGVGTLALLQALAAEA